MHTRVVSFQNKSSSIIFICRCLWRPSFVKSDPDVCVDTSRIIWQPQENFRESWGSPKRLRGLPTRKGKGTRVWWHIRITPPGPSKGRPEGQRSLSGIATSPRTFRMVYGARQRRCRPSIDAEVSSSSELDENNITPFSWGRQIEGKTQTSSLSEKKLITILLRWWNSEQNDHTASQQHHRTSTVPVHDVWHVLELLLDRGQIVRGLDRLGKNKIVRKKMRSKYWFLIMFLNFIYIKPYIYFIYNKTTIENNYRGIHSNQ